MSDTIFSKNQNAILHHTNTWITFQFDSQQSIRAILYYFHVSLSNQFTKTLHPYVLLEQSLILRVLCYAMISCVWFLIQRNVNRKKVSFALSLSLSLDSLSYSPTFSLCTGQSSDMCHDCERTIGWKTFRFEVACLYSCQSSSASWLVAFHVFWLK